MGVYSVLGTTENGRGVVIALIPCAMAANRKKREQGSGGPTGTSWKWASAAAGMFLKAHRMTAGFGLPPLGLLWKQGCVKGGALSPGLAATHCSLELRPSQAHCAVWVYASLRQAGAVTVAGVHPQQVVYRLNGRADSCKYLRNEQMPQVHIKCNGCLSAPHDSVFTR